jgi:hypothetical protein
MCRVSGGMTGTREALLKDGDTRNPKVFATHQEAEDEAYRLNRTLNNAHSVAFFEYWVVPNSVP